MRGYTTRHRGIPKLIPRGEAELYKLHKPRGEAELFMWGVPRSRVVYSLIIPRRKIMAEKMISGQNKSNFYIGNRHKFM